MSDYNVSAIKVVTVPYNHAAQMQKKFEQATPDSWLFCQMATGLPQRAFKELIKFVNTEPEVVINVATSDVKKKKI